MGIRRTTPKAGQPSARTQPEHESFAIRLFVTQVCERGPTEPAAWLRPEIREWLLSLTSDQLLSFHDQITKWGVPMRHILSGRTTIYGGEGPGIPPWQMPRGHLNPETVSHKGAIYVRADLVAEETEIVHNGHRYVRADEAPRQEPQHVVEVHHHHHYGAPSCGPVIDHEPVCPALEAPAAPMPVLPLRVGGFDYHAIGEDGRPYQGKGRVARVERRPADYLRPAYLDGDPDDPLAWYWESI